MINQVYRGILLATFGTLFVPNAFAAPNAAQDARPTAAIMLAQTCAGCHGTEGYTRGDALVPLAGLPKVQFIRAMEKFADGSRQSTVMGSISRNLTAKEIELMADYFASFPENPPIAKGDKS
jgi:sulfide dehydrogenase cytochrome subunit